MNTLLLKNSDFNFRLAAFDCFSFRIDKYHCLKKEPIRSESIY